MTAPPADAPPTLSADAAAADPCVATTDAALRGLLPALRRLDRRLAAAAACVPAVHGAHVDGDRWRGLYVGAEDVAQLLAREALSGGLGAPARLRELGRRTPP